MTRRGVCTALVVGALVAATSLVVAAPALADPRGTQSRNRDDDRQVVITGRVVVAPQETVGDVAILNGDARINGKIGRAHV